MTGWTFIPCPEPGCGKQHPTYVHPAKRGPARPYSGPFVSPIRSETPRTGVDVLAVRVPPSDDPASTPVQAASTLASRLLGESS